jgi:hypothetical protein
MESYRESQRFAPWFDFLMLGLGLGLPLILFVTAETPQKGAGAFVLAPMILLIWALTSPMKTWIDAEGLRVRFGLIPSYGVTIRFDEIASAKVVDYDPLREYGGWGIRGIPVSCLNARGNRGVTLELKKGRSMLIGSQTPEDLYARLKPHIG